MSLCENSFPFQFWVPLAPHSNTMPIQMRSSAFGIRDSVFGIWDCVLNACQMTVQMRLSIVSAFHLAFHEPPISYFVGVVQAP